MVKCCDSRCAGERTASSPVTEPVERGVKPAGAGNLRRVLSCMFVLAALAACGGGGSGGGGGGGGGGNAPPPPSGTVDEQLRALIDELGLTGDPAAGRELSSIGEPLPQLGKLLFFSKSLSGDFDTACASCHHPALGGGDGLALPVGTGAVDPDVLGLGRTRPDGRPNVGRHSQTVFNVGLYDRSLFWDSRVESIGKEAGLNGAGSGIRTPESPLNAEDPLVPVGMTLPAAQARLPVAVPGEMRGSLLPGAEPEAVRQHLAARLGDYGSAQGELGANNGWLAEFQTAFASGEPAEQLITFDNIALALAEYQRSMVFVDTPWKRYIEGDTSAINANAKLGALLFFRDTGEGGVACGQCHSGDFLTDERHTIVGFPQIGPGKGDGTSGDADFGREQQSANSNERFRFRTPSLLNLGVTAPYTHSGVYELQDTLRHYFIPQDIFSDFLNRRNVCSIRQFRDVPDCETMFPNIVANSTEARLAAIQTRTSEPDVAFPDNSASPGSDEPPLLAFLGSLTDPCTQDRQCLAPWIPEPAEAPDDHQLNAVNADGEPL